MSKGGLVQDPAIERLQRQIDELNKRLDYLEDLLLDLHSIVDTGEHFDE